eukprot:TRINITY_DN19021_c0_g2_i3.p1 TRINITY_DN19021_c0_g2~~TRINITY_DN19021_c0_g2_i3.p1  ORF type:complete len:420 (-),score=25.84 TRINITY_DN19021_c0_g2_i3:60-1319(-)
MLAVARFLLSCSMPLTLSSASSTCESVGKREKQGHFSLAIPSGQEKQWGWQTYDTGRCQNFRAVTDNPLDFFTASGHDALERIRDVPASCKQCYHFDINFTFDGDWKVVRVYNRNRVHRSVYLNITVTNYMFQGCLFGIGTHLTSVCILFGVFVCFVVLLFYLAGLIFGVKGTREDAWDTAWTKQIGESWQCPQRPSERMMSWAWHACVFTYPWNPWRNDPLNYPCRCLVLVANVFMMFLTSAAHYLLMRHSVRSKHGSNTYWRIRVVEDFQPADLESVDLRSVLLISATAMILSQAVRAIFVGIFRCGLNVFHTHRSTNLKVFGVTVSVMTIPTFGGMSLWFAMKERNCYVMRAAILRFLFAQLITVPMSFLGAILQYIGLWYCGRRNVSAELINEIREQVTVIALNNVPDLAASHEL